MLRALVADDERASASIIQYFLDDFKVPVEIVGVATDGLQAVQYIKELRPDLVFLDIKMPRLDGFEVMDSVGQECSFIMITAYDSFQNAQEALRHGAKDILHKPINGDLLMQAIMRTLSYQPTTNGVVNGLLEYLHMYYDKRISLDLLSEKFFLTQNHMARVFKKYTGKSIINYLHTIRISKAKDLLANTEKQVKEIALLLGYENTNNFYKHFKIETGLTPRSFRQNKQYITMSYGGG